jgi:hypothetical protein
MGAGEGESDILARIGAAASEIVPSRRAASILASELAVLYFAFASWRQRSHTPAGSRAFSIHEQSGVADLFGMLAAVSVIEAVLVHLAVARWSATAAWILSAMSLYGMVWLLAMARAIRLRPVLLHEGDLIAHSGMLWTVRVPLTAIVAVESGLAESDMKLPPAVEPNVTLRFAAPVTAEGMYGMTKRITSLGLAIDDRRGFERALQHEI